MGITICIVSKKGGVGKTLTAVNLSAALAMSGRRTILVDCDPQGSASATACLLKGKTGLTLREGLLGRASAQDLLAQSCLYNLGVIPAPMTYLQPNDHIVAVPAAENLLKNFLLDAKQDSDFIVIDTPATFGMHTLNAIIAADAALIPIQCEYLAFRSLHQTMQALIFFAEKYNPSLKLAGILLTMYDADAHISTRIVQSARKRFGKSLLQTIIPRDTHLRDSPASAKPLVVEDSTSAGARSYIQLAGEVMHRLKSNFNTQK
jgi:chromosome partitioning protein